MDLNEICKKSLNYGLNSPEYLRYHLKQARLYHNIMTLDVSRVVGNSFLL